MADEDNFDIDIYGDDADQQDQYTGNEELNQPGEGDNGASHNQEQKAPAVQAGDGGNMEHDGNANGVESHEAEANDQHMDTSESHTQPEPQPAQQPTSQGTKRKEGSDDRPIDPNATTALLISDMHWWESEEDIRGLANQAECEDELRDITFNEHKVNGKSKGQSFVDFTTQQAATALKHKIEAIDQGGNRKRFVQFHNPHTNPYKTLPKDVPGRNNASRPDNRGGNFGGNQGSRGDFNRGGFGGGRNFNNRGGGMNNQHSGGGGGFNRNFTPPMGGMPTQPTQGGAAGGFGGPPMGGFGGGNMAMQNFGNNFNRGGFGGGMRGGGMPPNRGGRGGMAGGPGMMGGMAMGGMNGMGMPGMPMGGMNGNMGMGGMQGIYTDSPPLHNHHHTARSRPSPSGGNPRHQPVGGGAADPKRPRPHQSGHNPLPKKQQRNTSIPSVNLPALNLATLAAQFKAQAMTSPHAGSPAQGLSTGPFSPQSFPSLLQAYGFGGQGHFNPAFFGQNQGGGGGAGDWNPHGAKRPRPE